VIGIRVIPCLLLKGAGLVKTIRFQDSTYLGDPRNVVRIFNEREVDELVIFDITATRDHRSPQFDLIKEIVSEAFMPVGYGGGIRNIMDARKLFNLGVEKIVINSYAVENPEFIRELAGQFGSQSIIVCMDVKKDKRGDYQIWTHAGGKLASLSPIDHALKIAEMGAGELIVNSIDRDGTMSGYDIEIIRMITKSVNIPVVACGGAGRLEDFRKAVQAGGAAAVAAGSIFVFHGKHRAVLISYPTQQELHMIFRKTEG
jgi:cyclase